MTPLDELVAALAREHGPLRFDEVVALALYHRDHGFYLRGGRAGRRGDFLTSPEVGPLFGAVLARALDAWWEGVGRPDPFEVVEAGAGTGTLARSVLAARPMCRDAMRYVAVEASPALRAEHPDGVASVERLPDGPITGVVVANELLDNLPFRLLERGDRAWQEVRVAPGPSGLEEVLVPGEDAPEVDAPVGSRVALQEAAAGWLEGALGRVTRGRVVVIDYASTTAEMARRPWTDWVRTYRAHERGGHPLEDLGAQDVTCEVAVDQLAAVRPPDEDRSQAEFLRAHGLDDLVSEGRRIWEERAATGDLDAIRARSRIAEAEALTDAAGLGGFRVWEWERS